MTRACLMAEEYPQRKFWAEADAGSQWQWVMTRADFGCVQFEDTGGAG